MIQRGTERYIETQRSTKRNTEIHMYICIYIYREREKGTERHEEMQYNEIHGHTEKYKEIQRDT